jgi:hypothetical protein
VRSSVSQNTIRTQDEDVREGDAEANIWTHGVKSNRGLDK